MSSTNPTAPSSEQQRRPGVADDPAVQRRGREPEIGVVFRDIAALRLSADVSTSAAAAPRSRRLHSADDFEIPRAAIVDAELLVVIIGTQSVARLRIRESRRRHADNRVGAPRCVIVLPMTSLSPPKRCTQNPWLRTTTLCFPVRSRRAEPRPRIGLTRSTSKKPALTWRRRARMGVAAAG